MRVFVGGGGHVARAARRALAAWGLQTEALPSAAAFPGDVRPVTATLAYAWPLYDLAPLRDCWTIWLLSPGERAGLEPASLALLHHLRGGNGPPLLAAVSPYGALRFPILETLGLRVLPARLGEVVRHLRDVPVATALLSSAAVLRAYLTCLGPIVHDIKNGWFFQEVRSNAPWLVRSLFRLLRGDFNKLGAEKWANLCSRTLLYLDSRDAECRDLLTHWTELWGECGR